MARSFTAGSTQYLEAASVPVSGWPLTMACWFRVPNITGNHTLFFLAKSTGVGYVGLSARGDLVGDPLEAYVDNGTPAMATSSAGFTANTWHHACLVRASDTSLVVYLNGGNSGSSATSKTWASIAPTHTQIGIVWYSGSRVGPLTGYIADAAIWSAALTADEVAAMATGLRTADQVRPSALVAQWPLGGLRPDNDRDQWSRAYDLTAVNSPTSVDHPRLWYPSAPQIINAAASTTKYSWWAWGTFGNV